MFNDPPPSPFPYGQNPDEPKKPDDQSPPSQRLSNNPTSIRVPDKAARGVFATGVLIIHGQQELVLDFIQGLARPAQLVARVVVTPPVAEQLLSTLQENYNRYTKSFGEPPALPKPPPEPRKSPQEIYDELKISDDMLSGAYANAVMVGHTPAEFHVDFVTSFFPNAAVSSRVYVSAPRMPQFIETLTLSLGNYRRQQQHPPQAP